jgi:hypothetical protein
LQEIQPKHKEIGFFIRILREHWPISRRNHLDDARMSFRRRDIEKCNAAAGNGAHREHCVKHTRWIMIGGVFGAARHLEHAVAASERLTDRPAPNAGRGSCERDLRHR